MSIHPAWSLLFYDPRFWTGLGNKFHMCNLRQVCAQFREEIPEREAIRYLFGGCMLPKAQLLRLLPLTVHDVLKLRSPVDFFKGFELAEAKVGGFPRCMAMIREKQHDPRRMELRRRVQVALGSEYNYFVVDHEAMGAALRRSVQHVVRWEYHVHSRSGCNRHEDYVRLKLLFRHMGGKWYAGICEDVRLAYIAIQRARLQPAPCVRFHWTVTRRQQALFIGVIRVVAAPPVGSA